MQRHGLRWMTAYPIAIGDRILVEAVEEKEVKNQSIESLNH